MHFFFCAPVRESYRRKNYALIEKVADGKRAKILCLQQRPNEADTGHATEQYLSHGIFGQFIERSSVVNNKRKDGFKNTVHLGHSIG